MAHYLILITRADIIRTIEENNFFIPNINGDISEDQWHWCHIIRNKCSTMLDASIKEKLFQTSQEIVKEYTTIGKYRIDSLNNQYGIISAENDNAVQ